MPTLIATPMVETTAAAGRTGLTSFHFAPSPPSARMTTRAA